MDIAIQNPHRYRALDTSGLRQWLSALLRELAPHANSFGLRLVDDSECRSLNRQYRGKDTSTDVLSFPGEAGVEGQHVGDVVVSIPTARSQAEAAGLTLQMELRQLVLHGLLHCLGYDHETDAGEMDRVELDLRRRWLVDVE